ncbi:hypothetical protein RHMOL_Rhmol01G0283700 [Rhododendron molle]|uniref:Uncharacterized protein n=1 Tax=Rhododendron molle TaxID=49168 RepID=A0ACC0Q691_RHOML|nr:hypothetical protein RHMOL_Rhmol01G0283700 [Rhododendron molle]
MEAGENLLHTMQLATYADRLVYDNNCCSICLHHYGPGDMVCFYLPCLQHVHNRCQQQWHIQNCPNCNTIWSFIGLRHPSRVDVRPLLHSHPEDLNPNFVDQPANQFGVFVDEDGFEWQM